MKKLFLFFLISSWLVVILCFTSFAASKKVYTMKPNAQKQIGTYKELPTFETQSSIDLGYTWTAEGMPTTFNSAKMTIYLIAPTKGKYKFKVRYGNWNTIVYTVNNTTNKPKAKKVIKSGESYNTFFDFVVACDKPAQCAAEISNVK